MVSDSELAMSIGIIERVEALRRESGVKKSVMYEATGVSSSAISQWRSGLTKPALKSVAALADFFGVTTSYLMFGEKEKPAVSGELSSKQRELIDIVQRLAPSDVAVLLAAARELAAARQYQGGQE